ncbi:hypothetical protein Ahy_B04g070857 [Arachis hypogaea]|uniref:RNase H type-1 domain-containing protein n=1 Tax=Arachis hypogaea TaxID=3818 RepID=A0A444ZJA9_ARAHY|nr:hypothetical protein Ahy_B04g070857 [Arachis hypogaea]
MFRKCNQGGRIEANQMWSRIGITMWAIWKTRNKKVFHDTEPDPKSTINYAKNLELEYFKATEKENNSTKESNRRRTVPIICRAPPQNWLKLNTDAAFSNDTKSGSIAVAIRDCNGTLMGGTNSKIQTNSSILAEATAIREAIILIENLKIENATIESDCFQLIQAIKEGNTFWEVEPIIQDIKAIQKRLPNCGFSWIPREGNKLAHTLASLKLQNQLTNNWPSNPPKQIAEIIRNEKLGLPSHHQWRHV